VRSRDLVHTGPRECRAPCPLTIVDEHSCDCPVNDGERQVGSDDVLDRLPHLLTVWGPPLGPQGLMIDEIVHELLRLKARALDVDVNADSAEDADDVVTNQNSLGP
jgi:hypothetical protein